MTIRPLGDRLLIKPISEDEVTKSGIILPATVDREKKAEGEIVAIGNGEKVSKLELAIGQKVIFGRYAGEEIKVEDQDYRILEYKDVLAVVV